MLGFACPMKYGKISEQVLNVEDLRSKVNKHFEKFSEAGQVKFCK